MIPNTPIVSESEQTVWFNNHDVQLYQQIITNQSQRVVSTIKQYTTANNVKFNGPKIIVNRQGEYDRKVQDKPTTKAAWIMAFLACMMASGGMKVAKGETPVVNPRKK